MKVEAQGDKYGRWTVIIMHTLLTTNEGLLHGRVAYHDLIRFVCCYLIG